MSVCSDPDVLSAMLIVNNVLSMIKIIVPVLLILTGIISMAKAILSTDPSQINSTVKELIIKFFVAVGVFLVPTVMYTVFGWVEPNKEFMKCFVNATPQNISGSLVAIAMQMVSTAEQNLDIVSLDKAEQAVAKLQNGTTKDNLNKRLEKVAELIAKGQTITPAPKPTPSPTPNPTPAPKPGSGQKPGAGKKPEAGGSGNNGGKGSLDPGKSSTSNGKGKCQKGKYQKSEPDPSSAINCWPKVIDSDDFIYPKDKKTGLPLGAWPKDYEKYPTQLTSYKLYKNTFIFPVTPSGGKYHFVYQHNGIDFMAKFGEPIYSPADGKLVYSEWDHTSNRGGDETAYSVTIELSKPVKVSGKKISTLFLTHMSGIRYRCAWGKCNRNVKKGQLLGFVGNAAGSSESVGWAPHLHMTMHPPGNYNAGLQTTQIETLYGIPNKTNSYKIKAGG